MPNQKTTALTVNVNTTQTFVQVLIVRHSKQPLTSLTTETTTHNPFLPNTAVTAVSCTSQEGTFHSNNRNLCVLKTAFATVSNSSQKSFMSEFLANSLQLQSLKREKIHLSAFTSQTPSPQKLEVGKIYLETNTGTKLPLSVLIAPKIAVSSSECCSATDLPAILPTRAHTSASSLR